MKRTLYLPAAPGQATADLITSMDLPVEWNQYLATLDNYLVFASGTQLGRVITFAYEAKSCDQVSASHQLALYLCSAQYQRKALGFQGQLFGATLVDNTLTVYVSEWKFDKVVCCNFPY